MKIAVSNNHSTQQSSQLSKQEAPKPSRRNLELLKNYPWLLLVIVAALSVAISAIAISSLVSIGGVDKPTQTSSNPEQTTQFSEPQPHKATSWLLAIVLLGAGAVVIYRRRKGLGMPNFSWQMARNSWHTAKSRLTRRQQRKLLLQQSKTTAFVVEPQNAGEPAPIADAEIVEPQPTFASPATDIVADEDNNSSNLNPEVFVLSLEDLVDDDLQSPTEIEVMEASLASSDEAVVTILSLEEDEQSIDPRTRSLAEMMDIRNHLSLNAILQDFHPKSKAP